MKYFILLFVFMLFSSISFSQNQGETRSDIVKGKKSGEIIKGKNVAYRVLKDDIYYMIKNVVIQDTLWYHFDGKLAPKKMREQIEEIVYKHIKMEDLSLSYKEFEEYGMLAISFILNKELKVEKIMFFLEHGEFLRGNDERDFWITLSMDLYSEIEKEIMEMNPLIEEADKEWIREMDFTNGSFLYVKISYKGLLEALNAKESETKE